MRHLGRLTTPDEISEALDKLPEGLEQTYRGILQRFGAATSDVRSVLGFIAFALRPPTLSEVVAGLSFNSTTGETRSFDIDDQEAFIRLQLPGMIDIVDSEKGDPRLLYPSSSSLEAESDPKRIVQFIHFSVKEYLTNNNICRDEKVGGYYLDQYFANVSISTLSLAALEPKNQPALGGLAGYAAQHWHEHVPADLQEGNVTPNNSDHPDAAEQREAAERLDSALTAFLSPDSDSPAFRSWKMLRSKLATPRAGWALGLTPLHCVVRLGLHGLVTRLIKQGADYNAFAYGQTALHHAVKHKAVSCTEALLKNNADPKLTQGDGLAPLHVAACSGLVSAVRALLENGADIRARTTLAIGYARIWISAPLQIGVTPLHVAVQEGEINICQFLLGWKDSGGLGDIPDCTGRTPLHYAARYNRPGITEILLRGGANAYAHDASGETPLSLAQAKEHGKCVKLLEQHLQRLACSDKSELDHPVVQDPFPPKSPSSLTLYAYLKLDAPASSADKSKQRLRIVCSVNMGWSRDNNPICNNCMLIVILCPEGQDGVHCVPKLYGINADKSSWRIMPQRRLERSSFSLGSKTQSDCRTAVATALRTGNVQQYTEEEAAPRLLVYLEPAGEVASHPPMSFPLPPPSSKQWKAFGRLKSENQFILRQLTTAALHFQSCRQNVTSTADKSKEQIVGTEPTSNVDVAEAQQDFPFPPPSSVGGAQEQNASLSSAASTPRDTTTDRPTMHTATPLTFSTSILVLCAVVVTVAVVYAAMSTGITRTACQWRVEDL